MHIASNSYGGLQTASEVTSGLGFELSDLNNLCHHASLTSNPYIRNLIREVLGYYCWEKGLRITFSFGKGPFLSERPSFLTLGAPYPKGRSIHACKVSTLVWSIFVGQNADLTTGRDCIRKMGVDNVYSVPYVTPPSHFAWGLNRSLIPTLSDEISDIGVKCLQCFNFPRRRRFIINWLSRVASPQVKRRRVQ